MSSGKFCCKSWRKLLVPGSCPTSLLEVNCCFFSTAKNTCASIPAAPAHSPASSSAPAHPAAGFVLSVLQHTPHLQLFMGLGIFFPFSMELMWCKEGRRGWRPGRSGFFFQTGTILPESRNQIFSLLSLQQGSWQNSRPCFVTELFQLITNNCFIAAISWRTLSFQSLV